MDTAIFPEPEFEKLKPALMERLERIGAGIDAGRFVSHLDPLMRHALGQAFAAVNADEGTVWLLDAPGENLLPAFTLGPHAGLLQQGFKQPLNAGLISMVFASEQPFLENEVWKNARQNKSLDTLLRVRTCAMIAVPFYLLRDCRGVLSCVQLQNPDSPEPGPAGFQAGHLAAIERAAELLARLIEFRLVAQIVGWRAD